MFLAVSSHRDSFVVAILRIPKSYCSNELMQQMFQPLNLTRREGGGRGRGRGRKEGEREKEEGSI